MKFLLQENVFENAIGEILSSGRWVNEVWEVWSMISTGNFRVINEKEGCKVKGPGWYHFMERARHFTTLFNNPIFLLPFKLNGIDQTIFEVVSI